VAPGSEDPSSAARDGLVERVDGIAAWLNDLDARLRATELATSDEKTAKELRRAVEALSKHDPKLEKRLTNRVDVLADRLATLASTVSTTAASLARKDGEIAGLRKDLEDGSKRLEALVREFGKTAGAAEVEKLRAAISAVQSERPSRSSDSRIEGLSRKVDYLTERVDTLGKTVATTAAGLVGREGEIASLRQRLEEGSERIEQTAIELRRVEGGGALARRLDGLQTALEATNTGLEAREKEVAALRSRIDEAYSRVGSVVAELQSSIADLSTEVETLPGAAERALEVRASELDGRINGLSERVESLATSVESAMRALVERDTEVGTLTRRVDEASAHVEVVVGELKQALAELPPAGFVEEKVEAGFAALGASVLAATDRVAALESTSSTRSVALETALADAGQRLEALERDRAAAATQLEQIDAAWSEERAWVRSRLGELAAADADAAQMREAVGALTVQLQAIESDRAAAAAEIVRVSAALDAEQEALRTQLAGLATGLAEASAEARAAGGGAQALERVVTDLTARLQSVEEDGAAVASGLVRVSAALDAERGALHDQVERITARLAEVNAVDEASERALQDLDTRLQALEGDSAAAATEIAQVSAALDAEQEALRAQLNALATTIGEQQASAASAEGTERALHDLAGRLQRLEADGADALEQVVTDLTARLQSVEADGTAVASGLARVSAALDAEREALHARLESVAAGLAEVSAGDEESERELQDLGTRLQALEGDRAAAASEIAQVSAALDAEREALRAQLNALATTLAEQQASAASAESTERMLHDLAGRLQRLEADGAAVASEIARVSAALDAGRETLHGQLDALATRLAETGARTSPSGGDEQTQRRLGELASRLQSLEEGGAAVASELSRTAALWASELETMETRLDRVTATLGAATDAEAETERLLAELAGRLESMERDRQVERSAVEARLEEVASHVADVESSAHGGATAASEGDVAQLRVAVDGLRMRLATSEQELAALVRARDTSARLDELTRRLEALERAPIVLAGGGDGGPAPGDGRFRLELRALELRMEHAEAAARENREAVLVQLERLAARIEWRFQRLEAEYEARQPQAVGGGQVVPIRPADA
jgi:chromosome segregation ATPase